MVWWLVYQFVLGEGHNCNSFKDFIVQIKKRFHWYTFSFDNQEDLLNLCVILYFILIDYASFFFFKTYFWVDISGLPFVMTCYWECIHWHVLGGLDILNMAPQVYTQVVNCTWCLNLNKKVLFMVLHNLNGFLQNDLWNKERGRT